MNLRSLLPAFAGLLALVSTAINGQQANPPFLEYLNHRWVDSVMKALTPAERLAQLVWVAGFANRDASYDYELASTVAGKGLGGVIFFQGEAGRQAELVNLMRKISEVPPFIATDAETGAGMRLNGIRKFPNQLTLGAITDDSLIFRMGEAVADQCRRSGVNINLAPVADVDNNPENPVINFRSFGEDPAAVAAKSVMYMKGLEKNGIMAVAKHFPGHGDTRTDSHLDLPLLDHSRSRLDSIELVPFRSLITNGISGVMPGHLWVPAIEPGKNTPSTISDSILTGLLRRDMGFRGLILSDAMNMGGITKYAQLGEAEFLALKAGMDVLEYVTDPDLVIATITEKIKSGKISQQLIDEKCRKVLAAKYWAGLSMASPVLTEGIEDDLSSRSNEALIRDLYSNSLTLLKNDNNLVPLKGIGSLRIATLSINSSSVTPYQERLGSYTRTDHFTISTFTAKETGLLLKKLSGYDLVVAGIFGTEQKANLGFGIPEGLNRFLDTLVSVSRCFITYFGNPHALARLDAIAGAKGVLLAYQENEITQDLAAQLVFGGIGAKGRLPVTINDLWKTGFGLASEGGIRLGFGIPENTGLHSEILHQSIDSLAENGLMKGAYPGCEIMIARKGTVIFHKTYGYHTYDKRTPVAEEDLFDLASVSKISGSLPGLMKLDGEGKFSTDRTIGYYLPEFRRSNKEDIVLKEMLAHQAGLVAWIPFWRETIGKDGEFRPRTFSYGRSEKYPLRVADELYMHRNYREKIFREIKQSKVSTEKKYLYSDLAFIIAPEILAAITSEDWPVYVTENIYHRLGAYDITFNPWQKYPSERIVPTEYDSLFRKQQLHGTVHDEGAAMLGGVSGHAGLFATAGDLMKLMEMYRRMGSYGGEQIIDENVMKKYTSCQFPENNNRRGLGFDKPQVNIGDPSLKNPYPTKSASPESFGHSGYTGTFVWIDPKKEFTYIFFCNRVYPTRNNNLLSDMNIRTGILQAIYDSIR